MPRHVLTDEERKAGQFQTGEKAVESGRKAGIASGEAKRAKKSMKELAKQLMDAPVGKDLGNTLELYGVSKEDKTYRAAIMARLVTSLPRRRILAAPAAANTTTKPLC